MRRRCAEGGAAGRGENFTKMKRKRIFSIPSSTSRTLIRRSWIYTHSRRFSHSSPLHSVSFLFSRVSRSAPLICVSSSSYSHSHPSRRTTAHSPSLKKTRRVAGISDTLRHNRKCHGNAITCRKK